MLKKNDFIKGKSPWDGEYDSSIKTVTSGFGIFGLAICPVGQIVNFLSGLVENNTPKTMNEIYDMRVNEYKVFCSNILI